ncbi:alpha/beta fold hydrolase [soil metagenome]
MNARIITLICILATLLPSLSLWAQPTLPDMVLSGSWTAVFNAPDRPARSVIMHITSYPGGPHETYIDVPDRGLYGLRMDTTLVRDPLISMVSTEVPMRFEAMFHRDQMYLEGLWKQGNKTWSFIARKIDRLAQRVQEPGPTVPYFRRPIRLLNRTGGVVLGGELVLPDTVRLWPAVILVSDGGVHDRDAEVSGHHPFLVLADLLARQGIATLRLDDRGIGSSGSYGSATLSDRVSDLEVAIDLLRTNAHIDHENVYVLGHGEGGVTAAHAASTRLGVAGLILMGTPALNGWDHLKAQITSQEKDRGTSKDVIKVYTGMADRWKSIVESSPNADSSAARIERYHEELIASKAASIEKYRRFRTFIQGDQHAYVRSTMLPRLQEISELDLPASLPTSSCRLLVLSAEKDAEVPASVHVPAFAKIKQPKGRSVATITFPMMNHWFQSCLACTAEEMSMLNETISPTVVSKISEWLLQAQRK